MFVNQEILKELRDIHWPEPPAIWPFAFGYYVVLALLILAALATIYFFLWGRTRQKLRKAIMGELNLMETAFVSDGDTARLQTAIGALLRRMVFLRNPDDLSRASDLDQMAPTLMKILPNAKKTTQLIEYLKRDRFKRSPSIDGVLLVNLVREQIKRCRI